MTDSDKITLLGITRDITVAQISSANITAYRESGEMTAEYFEIVYKKMVELFSAE